MSQGLKIEHILPQSIADQVGMEKGDRMIAINGCRLEDILDYRYLEAEQELSISLHKANGEDWVVDIEKDHGESLGVDLEGLGAIRQCANSCMFCFVDQMPEDMRNSLYVKDDDYRHSFLFGNFITLTNITDKQLERIAALKLSPLYVSVHTTNPLLRRKLMGTDRAADIMKQLRFLTEAGIVIHTQVVLCPGINDGEELAGTIADLAALWPQVQSLAVVPVGLTGHRQGLPDIKPFNRSIARDTLSLIEDQQKLLLERFGSRFVFAADELYLKAGRGIPAGDNYENFPQLENGVGLVRQFLDQWDEAVDSTLIHANKNTKYYIGTGQAAAPIMRSLIVALNRRYENLNIKVVTLDNYFFGGKVTVSGLITGADVVKNVMQKLTIPERKEGILLLPDVMLREETGRFLDDMDIDEVSRELEMNTKLVETTPTGLLAALDFDTTHQAAKEHQDN